MKYYNKIKTDYNEVLDNCCYVTSAAIILQSKGYVIIITSLFRQELCSVWNF